MSKIDERPVLNFKRDYELKNPEEWVTAEPVIYKNNRDQVRKLRQAVDNGVIRGRVEGFIALKLGCYRVATTPE